MITEQQSREAFEKFRKLPPTDTFTTALRAGYVNDAWRHALYTGWQAALKFAEEQQNSERVVISSYRFGKDAEGNKTFEEVTPPSPQPPAGYHLATDEERKCLPEGTVWMEKGGIEWIPGPGAVGMKALSKCDYACPDAPALVTFTTDGKIDPPPFGAWYRTDWTEEHLKGGFRPLLKGERRNPLDDYELYGNPDRVFTRRPLPAPPAEEWVPLTAEDVPPGSALRFAGHTLTWEAIIGTDEDGVWDSSNELVTWEQLFEEREILRPGQDWKPCKKLKTK
jgi:hypothetical protein